MCVSCQEEKKSHRLITLENSRDENIDQTLVSQNTH